jgi:hypothetical protein
MHGMKLLQDGKERWGKTIPVTGRETSRLPHFLCTIGSQMAMKFSALRARRPVPDRKFLVVISVRGRVDPRAIVGLEGLFILKKVRRMEIQTCDIPACSIVPPPTTLPVAGVSMHLSLEEPNLK